MYTYIEESIHELIYAKRIYTLLYKKTYLSIIYLIAV